MKGAQMTTVMNVSRETRVLLKFFPLNVIS